MKFNLDDMVSVNDTHDGGFYAIGIITDFQIDDDHEKYFVETGNRLSTRFYDVTSLEAYNG